MIDRAKKSNIDIPAHEMIEKHGSKIQISRQNNKPNHPRAFISLN